MRPEDFREVKTPTTSAAGVFRLNFYLAATTVTVTVATTECASATFTE
jgi:hypothetical protein